MLVAAAALGSSSVTFPAPAPGKVKVEMLTIKASSMPTLTAKVGTGVHAVALIGKSRKKQGTYVAYIAMFAGSGSSATGAVTLQIPNGTPAGKPTDVSDECSVIRLLALTGGLKGSPELYKVIDALAYRPLTKDDSPPPTEFKNDVEYQAKSVPCT